MAFSPVRARARPLKAPSKLGWFVSCLASSDYGETRQNFLQICIYMAAPQNHFLIPQSTDYTQLLNLLSPSIIVKFFIISSKLSPHSLSIIILHTRHTAISKMKGFLPLFSCVALVYALPPITARVDTPDAGSTCKFDDAVSQSFPFPLVEKFFFTSYDKVEESALIRSRDIRPVAHTLAK